MLWFLQLLDYPWPNSSFGGGSSAILGLSGQEMKNLHVFFNMQYLEKKIETIPSVSCL